METPRENDQLIVSDANETQKLDNTQTENEKQQELQK